MESVLNITLEVVLNQLELVISDKLASYFNKLCHNCYLNSGSRVTNVKIVYQSHNFLVVDKPYDLVINSDDPNRESLFKVLTQNHPELSSEKYKVQKIGKKEYPPLNCFFFFFTDESTSNFDDVMHFY